MLSHPSLFLPALTAALELSYRFYLALDTVSAVHDTIAYSIGQAFFRVAEAAASLPYRTMKLCESKVFRALEVGAERSSRS